MPDKVIIISVFREQSISCNYLFAWLFFSRGRLPRRNLLGLLERSAKLKSRRKRRRKRRVKTRNDRDGRRRRNERTRRRSTSFSKAGRKKWTISRTLRNRWKTSVKLDALSLRLWTNVLNLWKIQVGTGRNVIMYSDLFLFSLSRQLPLYVNSCTFIIIIVENGNENAIN